MLSEDGTSFVLASIASRILGQSDVLKSTGSSAGVFAQEWRSDEQHGPRFTKS